MDSKTLATILLRALGVSSFVYGVCSAPYFLITASFSNTFILSSLGILANVVGGGLLFLFSRPLAGLAIKGLDNRNSIPPPPPPSFENP